MKSSSDFAKTGFSQQVPDLYNEQVT